MPSKQSQDVTIVDGSLDFSGGVNSYVTPTIQSLNNPNGLRRNQLAWLDNATVRGSGITQRQGHLNRGKINADSFKYQGSFIYEPDTGKPYLIVVIGGIVWQVDPDDVSKAVRLSVSPATTMPASAERMYFCQAEQFLIIQCNDGVTLPLFWDGAYMRRSQGLIPGGGLSFNQKTLSMVLTNVDAPAGTHFDAMATTSNPLGVPYEAFIAPTPGLGSPGSDVTVTLKAPFGGSVGDTITYAGLSSSGLVHSVNADPETRPSGHSTTLYFYNFINVNVPQHTVIPGQTIYSVVGNHPFDISGWPADPAHPGGTFDGIQAIGAQMPSPGLNIPGGFMTDGIAQPPIFKNQDYTVKWNASYHFTVKSVYNSETQIQAQVSEIPAAGPMCYYMGRLWYAFGNTVAAGDIVGGQFGTTKYSLRDSVLKVSENPLALGGDGFTVPLQGGGEIIALDYAGNINTQLGQGQLYIFTNKQIYALTVPVTRQNWIAANANNMPMQTVAQITNGAINDRSIVAVNGDLFFQSLEPAIRSLTVAIRNFQQWSNVPISINENRILQFNDMTLMKFASGIEFSNRLLQTALPYETPAGVAFECLIPLNFDLISTLDSQLPPVWEGMLENHLGILEVTTANFNGVQRAFILAWNDVTASIEVWELTTNSRYDNNSSLADPSNPALPVEWYIEFPAYTWGNEFALKKLVSAEVWFDRLFGDINFSMYYRPDGDNCWQHWKDWQVRNALSDCEDVHNPVAVYPDRGGESFRQTVTLPYPPDPCQSVSGRPTNIGFQFQCKLVIKGWCRVRGLLLKAEHVEQELYGTMVC